MNGITEVGERYKEAVKQLVLFPSVAYHKGRVSGLEAALECLGVNSGERIKMFEACEEEVKDEEASRAIGPGDVNYDEEGFVIEEELDATERPVSQARVEAEQ